MLWPVVISNYLSQAITAQTVSQSYSWEGNISSVCEDFSPFYGIRKLITVKVAPKGGEITGMQPLQTPKIEIYKI
jgi:hypothetical protein